MAPELLPFQFKLVETVLRMINKQEKKIEQDGQQSQDANDRFYVNIHKMELERIKFTLKSYLRARLAKVERHLLYIVEKDQSALLSQAE